MTKQRGITRPAPNSDQWDRRDVAGAAIAVIFVNTIGAAPAVAFGADTDWFDHPWFYPPEALFPIAWTVLFTLIGVAAYAVWRAGTVRRDVRIALGWFAIQLALNLAWTPMFFGLRRPDLGLAIIVALWVTLLATIVTFHRVSSIAGWLLVPYLVWVTFATVLNAAILFGW